MLNNYRAICVLIEAKNTNPQGNPDEDNRPRVNPNNNKGFITGVGLKRKIRDYLQLTGNDIYVARNVCLEDQRDGLGAKSSKRGSKEALDLYDAVADKYIDVRVFGQLIPSAGRALRGPIQVSDGVSIDPVDVIDIAMTRVAVETKKESESQDGGNQTMASKSVISYGLYKFYIFVNPHDSVRSKCSEEDYEKVMDALLKCLQNDCSSARILTMRAVYEITFPKIEKDGTIGAAPMQHLVEQINIAKKNPEATPESFEDYEVTLGDDLKKAIENKKVVFKDRLRELINQTIGA